MGEYLCVDQRAEFRLVGQYFDGDAGAVRTGPGGIANLFLSPGILSDGQAAFQQRDQDAALYGGADDARRPGRPGRRHPPDDSGDRARQIFPLAGSGIPHRAGVWEGFRGGVCLGGVRGEGDSTQRLFGHLGAGLKNLTAGVTWLEREIVSLPQIYDDCLAFIESAMWQSLTFLASIINQRRTSKK